MGKRSFFMQYSNDDDKYLLPHPTIMASTHISYPKRRHLGTLNNHRPQTYHRGFYPSDLFHATSLVPWGPR